MPSRRPRPTRNRTRRGARRAYKEAKTLGPIRPIPAAKTRKDGSPLLGSGQVYVTRTGQLFHPAWCAVVGNKWDQDPDGLLVIHEAEVGKRRRCEECASPLTG